MVAYVMFPDRFRLFQLVEGKDLHFGALFFERTVAAVRLAGLSAGRRAMFTHRLLQHVLSIAYQPIQETGVSSANAKVIRRAD